MLEKLFRSKALIRVLAIVLFNDGLHLREISRQGGVSPPETKRELGYLQEVGLIKLVKRGNQVVVFSNKECPFFIDLKNLYQKTEGVFSELREALGALEGVKYAFVFGSTARGEDTGRSDVDLLVVGGINEEKLGREIFGIQKKTGREINFILWREKTLVQKTRESNSFLSNIVKKMFWLAGDEIEFKRITEQKVAAKNTAR